MTCPHCGGQMAWFADLDQTWHVDPSGKGTWSCENIYCNPETLCGQCGEDLVSGVCPECGPTPEHIDYICDTQQED